MNKQQILRAMSFGQRVAEEETDELSMYFVETDHWDRLFRGEIDVVYGPKGSGKSALYSLLLARNSDLFDRNILLISAENPRGAPAFRDLTINPPVTEQEFIGLWKLYFVVLLYSTLKDYEIYNDSTKELGEALEAEGLVKKSLTLSTILKGVVDYVSSALRPNAVEGAIEIDPVTQLPKGFRGRITFSEPGKGTDSKVHSVDSLLALANSALGKTNFTSWLLLDRLDVAFADNSQLEVNALRALFRVYLDVLAFPLIKIKIFLRTDIWSRITAEGFREASHITRHLTINWNRNSLLNLVVRRIIHNKEVQAAYETDEGLSRRAVSDQENFFYRICPEQVDVGPNKPNTFEWLLTRTRDGTKFNAPREVIHFLSCLREVQVKRLEVGESEPDGEQLFARPSFKDALPEVSKIRLEQTLYAEYPSVRELLEKMRGAKTSQTPETLAAIWSVSRELAETKALELAAIGFFESRGTQVSPEFWVPFLYRDSLELVQGAAE